MAMWRMRALGRTQLVLPRPSSAAPVSARADGCSVDDLWNAIESTASAITSDACAAACADTAEAGSTAAAGITAGLGVAAASQGQGAVDGFCSQVNNAQTAVGDVGALQSWANAAGMSLDLVSALGSIGDPLSIVQCSCSLEQASISLAATRCRVSRTPFAACNRTSDGAVAVAIRRRRSPPIARRLRIA